MIYTLQSIRTDKNEFSYVQNYIYHIIALLCSIFPHLWHREIPTHLCNILQYCPLVWEKIDILYFTTW